MSADLIAAFAAQRIDWIVPAWHGPPRVRAWFTTRRGGVSSGPEATFDLGPARLTPGHGNDAVMENRRRLRAWLPAHPVWLQQVHGVDVAEVLASRASASGADVTVPPALPPVADAAITRATDVVLTVRTADCLPVLLADRVGTVLAVAHAGWRGLAAGVLENTLAAMQVDARDVAAWIGPAIGPDAFEVGPDVWATYCARDSAAMPYFRPIREGKWMADLPGLARQRLARAGVMSIAGDAWCTHTDAERFFSYRRDPRAGRMALVAWLSA